MEVCVEWQDRLLDSIDGAKTNKKGRARMPGPCVRRGFIFETANRL